MENQNHFVESAEESDPQSDSVTIEGAAAQLEAIATDRDRLATEKAELQERLVRWQAEFENFRRRVERERAETMEYATMESLRGMLPVLDDFERALRVESADREYAKGMELIYQRLFDALKRLGLEPIPSAGQQFDPHLHHAVDMVETREAEDYAILEEYQRGYNFKGKQLRPAMVKVAVTPQRET